MDGTLYLGTSGFAYDEWKHGVFYPEGLKNREMLSYYASRFPSVEINYTFRRFPTEKSVETWKAETPETFRFTLKANQRITHWKRLADTDEDVRDFLDRGRLLGDRLGTVLYQCPPTLQYDRGLIEAFVGYLPPAPRTAMEFRHPSWAQARDLLLEQGVAWCVAETDENDPGPDDLSWEPFGFLRLRKTEYSDEELSAWVNRIRPSLEAGRDVYCYFKHEDEGLSTKMADRLRSMLSPVADGAAALSPRSAPGARVRARARVRDRRPCGRGRPERRTNRPRGHPRSPPWPDARRAAVLRRCG